MKTQIIKINTLTNSLKEIFKKLYKKLDKTQSQITVIVKSNQKVNQKNIKKLIRQSIICQQNNQIENQYHIEKIKSIIQNDRIVQKIDQQSIINQQDIQSLSQSVNISISNKQIFPNVVFTKKKSKKNISIKHIGSQKSVGKNKRNSKNITLDSLKPIANNNLPPQIQQIIKQKSSGDEQESKNKNGQCSKVKLTKLQKIKQKYQQLKDQHIEDNSQTSSMDDEQQESVTESSFQIQERLSDAIEYIKENRIFELEEYLYWFKTRYSSMSNRVQIKWRILMAYCKENRKQYERAAILYEQVIELSENSPKSFLVDPADIYHKLGICYTEINRWNDGIMSFSKALSLLKKNDKKVKYAECLNNLGALYLSAYQIQQAQKCFLLSYEIKQNQYPNHSKKLISCLFNLYQCNLRLKNYEQAQIVIKKIENITKTTKTIDMLQAGLLRRKGKLAFLKGDIEVAKSFFVKGLGLLQTRYPYSLEYGQLCHNLAVIKLEEQKIQEAKNLLSLALSRLNFYYTTDSYSIQNLKSNIEMALKLQKRYKEQKRIKDGDLNKHKSVDTIIEQSYGMEENSKST